MFLTRYAVAHRLATAAIIFALLVLGGYGLLRIPVDLLPNITYPLIKVHIWWRGATPDDVERNIAVPIERQMATVDGLDFLTSSSIEGMYTLEANFRYDVDVDVAYQDALAAMARVARELPRDIDPPIVIKADPSQLPVLQLVIASDEWDLTRLRTWTDEWLQDRLVAVPGVAGTEIVGGLRREIRIHIEPTALESHHLTLPDVMRRLDRENIQQIGGRVTRGSREIIARTLGEYQTLDDIRNVILLQEAGAQVRLGDVAHVEDAHEEVRIITRFNGRPAVKLSVLRQADANTVEVADAVARRIEELGPSLPAGIELGIVENQADYVGAALSGVRNAALEAAILVIVIMALFLGNWRQVVAMAWALPATLILNFGLMNLAGFSLNIFSLGGLVVAIAVNLDNSIIVIENITRLRRERPDLPVADIVVEATTQVGPAVIAATLSFIVLFLPFLLVPGLVSLLFGELIFVIAGVMLVSLVMAISVTPMVMAVLLGRRREGGETLSFFERLVERVTDRYAGMLDLALRNKAATAALFVVLLAVSGALLPSLGAEFLPKVDDGRVMIKLRLPTGAALGQLDAGLARIEEAISDDPLIDDYFTLAGGRVWGLYTYEIANEGEIDIQLVPRDQRSVSTADYISALQRRLQQVRLPAGRPMVMAPKIRGIRSLGRADIEVKIEGDDIERLYALANRTVEIMRGLSQFRNVYVSMDMTKPEYQVRIDRPRAAALGVSAADVASTVRTMVSGSVATRLRDGDEYYNIRLMVPETEFRSRADIENLLLPAQGGYVRVGDVADVVDAVGPVEIVREDQVKQVIVRGDAQGVSVGTALSALQEALAGVERPDGYEFSYGGQAQMMEEMQGNLLRVLVFAIFFAFIILVVQFDAVRMPLYILAGVPFSLAGLVLSLYFTRLPLGATVIIGMLVVVAANVMEGVLLLTYAEEIRRRDALRAHEAVIRSARIRFRPRLMTSLGVLIGFLPLALNLEEGGDMLQPMAVGAMGGLLATILVSLFLVPIFYVAFTRDAPQEARPGPDSTMLDVSTDLPPENAAT